MKTAYRRIYHLLVLLLLLGSWFALPVPARAAGALIKVNTTADTFDNDTKCSLREAIISANENKAYSGCAAGTTEMDTILLPAGTYNLTLKGSLEDKSRTGDLDILSTMEIVGAGVGKTIISAAGLAASPNPAPDRVFHVSQAGEVRLSGLEIRNGNAQPDDITGRGGGIFNYRSVLYVSSVLMDNNKSFNTGGGIDNSGGSYPTLSSSTIQNGRAKHGGGIFNEGSIAVTETIIYANTGTITGGGIDNNASSGEMVLTNVTIGKNISLPYGGSGASTGGAGIFNDGPLYIYNSTITQNSGYGLQVQQTSAGEIRNTIIAKQNPGTNCGFQDLGAIQNKFVSLGYNLEDTNTCNFIGPGDQKSVGATAVKLADTIQNLGGKTSVYALLAGSPAIDKGSNTRCPGSDQRWSTRPKDGNGDGIKTCDIGAFEYGPYIPYKIFMSVIRK